MIQSYCEPLKAAVDVYGIRIDSKQGWWVYSAEGKVADIPALFGAKKSDIDTQYASWVQEQWALDLPTHTGPVCQLLSYDKLWHTCQDLYDAGHRLFKLKVGRKSLQEDVTLVHALCHQFEQLTLRLDANQAWSIPEAMAFCNQIKAVMHRIEFIEEPTQDTDVRWMGDYPCQFAWDESYRLYQDVPDAIGVVVIKPYVMQHDRSICQEIAWLHTLHKKVVISSCYESHVGLHKLSQWASLTPLSPGLDT